jgi:hypothetical protein
MSYGYTDAFDESLAERFRAAQEATDFVVLPAGEYVVNAVNGKFDTTRNNTPEFKITLEVTEPEEFAGQRLFLDLYLSEKAIGMAKRDLKKFNVVDLDQIRNGWPATWRCRVKVVVQTSDQGNQRNKVQLLEVLERLDPAPEPFAPTNGQAAAGPTMLPKPEAADPFSAADNGEIPFLERQR